MFGVDEAQVAKVIISPIQAGFVAISAALGFIKQTIDVGNAYLCQLVQLDRSLRVDRSNKASRAVFFEQVNLVAGPAIALPHMLEGGLNDTYSKMVITTNAASTPARWLTTGGTPTPTSGMCIGAGVINPPLVIEGIMEMRNFRVISEGAGVQLNVQYYD